MTTQSTNQLRKILKTMGFSMTRLIDALHISRATFYKKLKRPNEDFIKQLKSITDPKLDAYLAMFDQELAHEGEEQDPVYQKLTKSGWVEMKYYQLLEDYSTLLRRYAYLTKLLVQAANSNQDKNLQKEIADFTNQN